jgi:alkylhydroperoxidase family enzyme
LQEFAMQTLRIRRAVSAAAVLLGMTVAANSAQADEAVKPQPKSISKSGIPYRPDSDQAGPPELVAAIRSRRTGGKLLNLDRMLLHSPNFAKGWNGMFGAIRNQLSLSPRLRETAIMAIGVLNHAQYEWAQHEKEYLATGATPEQLAALKDVDAAARDQKRFDEAERAALALTIEMTRNVEVAEPTLKRLRALLSDQQAVELIGTIAGYNMVSRFVVATGVEVE